MFNGRFVSPAIVDNSALRVRDNIARICQAVHIRVIVAINVFYIVYAIVHTFKYVLTVLVFVGYDVIAVRVS